MGYKSSHGELSGVKRSQKESKGSRRVKLRGVKRSQEDSRGLKTIQEKWKVKGSKEKSQGIKSHAMSR